MSGQGWGWAGSVGEFLAVDARQVLDDLRVHHRALLLKNPSGSQEAAWGAETDVMRRALVTAGADPAWGLAFEYELPLEGGRRPDVVLLAGSTILALEFKVGAATASQPMVDQAGAYARDLSEYHEASHGQRVLPLLVLTGGSDLDQMVRGVRVLSPDRLSQAIAASSTPGRIDLHSWLESPYVPLPTLVAAARRIFRHEPLPHVRRARSAGVPETVSLLRQLAETARQEDRRVLVFVAGVPGSGKTLVGLRAVYEGSGQAGAAFLSGNGPLVKVLQDALKSSVFVKDLHAYIRTYGIEGREPRENVLVFDEAQRAWDRHYMRAKRGIGQSEPELLTQIGLRMPEWCTLVGLVGEGQEIHSGEEGGIGQWREAVEASGVDLWEVHSPPRLADEFRGLNVTVHPELDLTVSLRSREAEELHRWVHLLLEGSIELAATQAARVVPYAFSMYLTRDLTGARRYLADRYAGQQEARFGLVCSSHTHLLQRFGIDNSWLATSKMNIARWFNGGADDSASCVRLDRTVTEFGCQGLELDMPVVCWGDDLRWQNGEWLYRPIRRRYPLEDPEQILENVYRVLLTRGRDGFIVYVPQAAELDQTAHALLAAGVRPLVADIGVAAVG